MVLPKCKCWGRLEPWQVYPTETGTFREMEPHGHTTKLEKAEEKDPPPIQSPAWHTHWQNPTVEDTSGTGSLGNTVLRCQPLWFRTRKVTHRSESKQIIVISLPYLSVWVSCFHYFVSLYCVQSSIFSVVKYALHTIYPLTTWKLCSLQCYIHIIVQHSPLSIACTTLTTIHCHNFFLPSQTETLAVK